MVEDRGKDEFSAQNLMKKHEALEAAVEDYRDNVRQLGEVARQLASEGHPQSEVIFLSCSCHSSTNSRTWYFFWLKFSSPFNHLKTNHSLISDILNMMWFFFQLFTPLFYEFFEKRSKLSNFWFMEFLFKLFMKFSYFSPLVSDYPKWRNSMLVWKNWPTKGEPSWMTLSNFSCWIVR